MKGIRFYAETEFRNVVAIFTGDEHRCPDGSQEALSAVYYQNNSPVAAGSVSHDFLAKHCKRVSESEARQLHPELFKRLDSNG